jgi:hypothetical protein
MQSSNPRQIGSRGLAQLPHQGNGAPATAFVTSRS